MKKAQLPERDIAIGYFFLLQNLAESATVSEMERQALNFALALMYQSIYGIVEEDEQERKEEEEIEEIKNVKELARRRK